MIRTLNGVQLKRAASFLPAGRLHRLVAACEVLVGLEIVLALVDTDVSPGLKLIRGAIVAAFTLAAVLATGRRSVASSPGTSAAAGFPALLLGTIGVAAGAVTGFGGLALAGVSLVAIVGVAGAIAGLVLAIVATVWLLGALPRWWRLAGIPAAFVVLQFWLLPLLMAVLGTHAPQPAFTAAAPAGAQRVSFAADDGTELVGWFTPSKNDATVIVLAGAGGTKADTTAQAGVLTRHGYGVLALDARGTGESGGHAMLWGWGGENDLSAAVSYLYSRPDVNPYRVGALGLSMGAEVAITAAALDPRLRAVVAEGATGRTCADLTFLPGDMEGTIHRADSCLGWSIAGLMTGTAQPAPLADEVHALGRRPLLLIAADLPNEHAATRAWQAESPDTIELWEPAATAHTAGVFAHPAEWESRVVAFLEASL